MVKQEEEVSVFFYTSKETLREFNEAIEEKNKELGIKLNKKQAFNLALKETIEIWKQKSPTE